MNFYESISGEMNTGGEIHAPLPLTLTLSHREREQQSARFDFFQAPLAVSELELLKRLGAILPLPKGEGRGEGKGSLTFFDAFERQEAFH